MCRRQGLTLALLVLGVLADHTHHATAVDDLALVTDLLYRCTNLHDFPSTAVTTAALCNQASVAKFFYL
jgi:hypothetical protein